jgi:ABC-type branched-subunit amino acid transport system substrate-binding protein
MKNLIAVSAIAVLLGLSGRAVAQQAADISATDTEIRIGNVMPYTGELAGFASIGRTEAAYFDMINEQGGVNGRKIKFITYNDNSDPETAAKELRKQVDKDNILFMFGSFGLSSNRAIKTYLNQQKIPQLFIASGDEQWSDPKDFPWTMGWQPAFRAEGRIYANYIQAYYSERKIAVLWQNDQFGRDLFTGLQEGLGDWARMIVSDITFDISDTSINSQIDVLKSSGAEILVFDGAPAVAALALRRMAELDWHPVFILDNASASIANALRPAGLENSIGVISTAFLKDAGDPAWKDDSAMNAWSAFMDKYYPDGDKADGSTVFGYAAAETMTQVLKQCGGDLSRENIMRQAESLKNYRSSLALPGIMINTGPVDFRPVKQMRLVQFDGTTWQPIGEIIESAFLGTNN